MSKGPRIISGGYPAMETGMPAPFNAPNSQSKRSKAKKNRPPPPHIHIEPSLGLCLSEVSGPPTEGVGFNEQPALDVPRQETEVERTQAPPGRAPTLEIPNLPGPTEAVNPVASNHETPNRAANNPREEGATINPERTQKEAQES